MYIEFFANIAVVECKSEGDKQLTMGDCEYWPYVLSISICNVDKVWGRHCVVQTYFPFVLWILRSLYKWHIYYPEGTKGGGAAGGTYVT